MQSKFTYNKLTWIDLESPNKDEVRQLADKYDIHPLVAEELLVESVRPKADFYGNFIYLVLQFPTVSHTHNGKSWQEVDFIIGKNFLITVHYESVDSLMEFSKIFKVNSVLDKSNMGEHAGFLFYYLMQELHGSLDNELDIIRKSLGDIENKIFSGNEKIMVGSISELNRKLLNFKKATKFHQEILASFSVSAKKMFGEKFDLYVSNIINRGVRIENELLGHKEILDDLWATNDSLLSTKTNEIMKIIAMISFVTFPLSLVAAIFGMNTSYLPIVGMSHDFTIVISIMALMMLGIFAYFRHKRWF